MTNTIWGMTIGGRVVIYPEAVTTSQGDSVETSRSASPDAAPMALRLRRARMLNVVLGAVTVFLLIVVIAQRGERSSSWLDTTDAGSAAADGDSAAMAEPADSTQAPSAAPYVRRIEGDPMALGSLDAPIVLSQWTDYRCPYCAVFATQTLPELIEQYVDTGQMRIEFHDVALFGQDSVDGAIAARAAGRQGRYYEYLQTVYAHAPARSHADLPRSTLIDFARHAGIDDMAQFEVDLDDPELRIEVERSHHQAQALGVSSVPFFVIDNKGIIGAQPLDAFEQFIEAALESAGS